jgi:hypothetical protein
MVEKALFRQPLLEPIYGSLGPFLAPHSNPLEKRRIHARLGRRGEFPPGSIPETCASDVFHDNPSLHIISL